MSVSLVIITFSHTSAFLRTENPVVCDQHDRERKRKRESSTLFIAIIYSHLHGAKIGIKNFHLKNITVTLQQILRNPSVFKPYGRNGILQNVKICKAFLP